MDKTLLHRGVPPAPPGETTEGGQPGPKTLEPAADGALEVSYRELPIEPPKPPLKIRLAPPLDYDGKTYTELVFDFDGLIGKDFQYAERTFNKMYKAEKNEAVMPEMKHLFHCILAAQVADVPVGVIMKLPRRYYTPLRLECLKACGSSPDEETES